MKRNDGQPESVHSGRIGRQDQSQDRALALVADRHTSLFAVTLSQDVEIQPSSQGVQDILHLGKDEVILLHIGPAHMLGQTRGCGLSPHKFIGRLSAIAQREFGVHVEFACLFDLLDEVIHRDSAERAPRPVGLSHVSLDQAAVRAAHFSDRFAGREMDYLIDVHAGVGLSPPQYRNI